MRTRIASMLVVFFLGAHVVLAQEIKGPGGDEYKKAQQEMAAGNLEQAKTLLTAALKKAQGADQVVVSGTLARVWSAMGKYPEAKAFLETRAAKSAAYKIELARLILESEPSGASEAADHLKQVVGMEPKNKEAWLQYGRALARAANFTEALRAYEMVTLHLDKKELRAYHGQAEVFLLQNQPGRARAIIEEALRIDPDSAETHRWHGRTYDRDRARAGNYSRAIECYETAYKLDHQASYLGDILFNLVMSENHDLAKSQARRLEKHPGDSYGSWFEGLQKEVAGDAAGALASQQRAVAANPGNVYAHFALAHLYSGEPTPGFGPVRGARSEGWRFAPQRDPRKAAGEAAVIKLLDPTFPFLSSLEASVSEGLAAEYPQAATPDEQSQARLKKLTEYFQQTLMTR